MPTSHYFEGPYLGNHRGPIAEIKSPISPIIVLSRSPLRGLLGGHAGIALNHGQPTTTTGHPNPPAHGIHSGHLPQPIPLFISAPRTKTPDFSRLLLPIFPADFQIRHLIPCLNEATRSQTIDRWLRDQRLEILSRQD